MKKSFCLTLLLAFSSVVFSQVGINTENPSETLDVNGKARVRNTDMLTSNIVSSLFVDENGVLGKSYINPSSPQTIFVKGLTSVDIVNDFNAGNIIVLPFTESNFGLNTLNATVVNNMIRIPVTGTYQLSASVNILFSTGVKGNTVYVAFNVQKSSNNGSTWVSESGARPIFMMHENISRFYDSVLPVVILNLNQNDLIRLVVFRTSAGGVLQGSEVIRGLIAPNSIHGTKSFTFSLSRL